MAASDITSTRWLDAAGVEPIAIVGAACRFSGNASSQDGLWHLLKKGMTSWASNARSRFKLESFWHPHAQLSGSTNSRGLHLLHQDPAVFDNDFFGISGVEAKAIDPQQRLMLEVAYEAFENAGIPLDRLEGSNTGVYCAVSYLDYDQIQGRDPEVSPMHRFTGTGPSLLANRVSYVFDLRGPSMSIDTACSSTLVALHEACRALRAGDVDQILVGGSNLILDPDKLTVISSMKFLSPHGRSYAFDSRANGYGRGEGVAAVLLKPLSAAIRDGDTVRAVVRGSATSSDGKTTGITMPSPTGQYDTIRRAYESAGLDPRNTPYVEAHGTGTNVGDSCEISAFSQAFCEQRTDKLLVGSIKANLGHTESVSGLAGLVKVLLMLEKGAIVSNPTFSSSNPSLELDTRGIQIPTKFREWPDGAVRRASVNGSGYGGTNAHVILEAWPEAGCAVESGTKTTDQRAISKPILFVWSHQREDGLPKMASTWKRFIMASCANEQQLSLDDLAFTLSSRRSRFGHRAAVVASNIQELLDGIGGIELGSRRPVKASLDTSVCYIFTGQGAQWHRMGLELICLFPVFAQSMQKAEKNLVRLGATWRLVEELKKGKATSRVNDAELSQPCCIAVQIALVDLLESWNVRPDVVCGHSSGEIAAAYAAGALTATDAIKVAYFRGKAAHYVARKGNTIQGGMLAVALSEADVQKYLLNCKDTITVACINSPFSVTLSGDITAIDALIAAFEADKVLNHKLDVEVAYHSPHMDMVEEYYRSRLDSLEPRALNPRVRMVSSVTGQDIQGQDLNGAYWTRNLLCPVRFSDALSAALLPRGNSVSSSVVQPAVMVEIGPHSQLCGPARQVVKSLARQQSISYFSCLKKNEDSAKTSLALAGELFTRGVPIALNYVNNPDKTLRKVLTNLPSYNWHHAKAHWSESRRSAAYRLRKFPRHDLLGNAAADSISTEPSWRNYIRQSEMPWIKGHCVDGQTVFSAAGFITMIVEALKRHCVATNCSWKRKVVQFKQIAIHRPLLIRDDDTFGAEVFTLLRPSSYPPRRSSSEWEEFRIYSITKDNESTEHCRGFVAISESNRRLRQTLPQSSGSKHDDCDANLWSQLEVKDFYRQLRSMGNEYSGCFANLEKVLARPWESRCELLVPDPKSTMPAHHQQPHCLHPTTLEGCFQACLPGLELANSLDGSQVVTAIEELYISTDLDLRPGQKLSVTTKAKPHGLKQHYADISAASVDNNSDPIIRAKGLRLSSLGNYRGHDDSATSSKESFYDQIEWRLDPFSSSRESVEEHCKKGLGGKTQQLRRLCDPFCRSLIRHTLAQLTAEDEAAMSGHLQLFLGWMRSQDISDAEPLSLSSEEKTSAVGAPGEMLVQLGHHLPEILRGSMKSLPLLLDDDLLYRLYFEDDCLNRCHAQLAEYLKLVQFKVPNLRILEIGGGTGSMTLALIESLYGDKCNYSSIRGSYVFTDVSTSFASRVQEKMKRFESFMDFKLLDIEQSPAQQGFDLGFFDVIVASNVVHATRNLEFTLGNLRSLLKPGGQIAMVELTAPSLRWGILGGGISGWWLGADEGRTSSPLLQTSQWDEVLVKSGFSGVSLEMKDYDLVEEHETSLIISHALMAEPKPPAKTITIIIGHSDDVVAKEIQHCLCAKLQGTEILISHLSDAKRSHGTYIFLLEILEEFLSKPSEDDWDRVRDIVCDAKAVLWVTEGVALTSTELRRALVTGFGRSLRSENPGLTFFTLDLDSGCTSVSKAASGIIQAYEKFLASNASPYSSSEWEIAIRDGSVIVPRLLANEVVNNWVEDTVSKCHPRLESSINPSRSLGLRIQSVGMLDSLYWADDPDHSLPPGPTQVRVCVEKFALNIGDMMTATGQLEGHSALLVEGSGTVVEVGDPSQSTFSVGDKICVFGPDGLATVSNIDIHQACMVPEGMSMETAAAMPVAYSTALFALRDVARLRQGETILIHSGASAIGQAAITIAQFFGAGDIFVTAGSVERRDLVRDKFGIPADCIISNRDLEFGDRVIELTGGRGVDIVLSSLSGDALAASCSAIAPFGRIIEVEKKNVVDNARLDMKYLAKNITFSVVDMTLVAKARPKLFNELMQTSLNMVQDKTLDLIGPVAATHASNVEEQLRAMKKQKPIGKVVLNLDSTLPLKIQPQRPKPAALRKDASYLIAGGASCLNKAILRYMAKLGAKRIITFSDSGGQGPGMEGFFEEVKRQGIHLLVLNGSVYDKASIRLIEDMSRDMSIRGVVLGDTPLKDIDAKSMTHSQWCEGISTTSMGILDLYTNLRKNLDFFIIVSSASTVTGWPGQGAYCARNAVWDAFARQQASMGSPIRAIDAGMAHDDGLASEDKDATSQPSPWQGFQPQCTAELLAVINYAIQNPVAETPAQAQIICGARHLGPDCGTGEAGCQQRPDARFSHVSSRTAPQVTKGADDDAFDAQSALQRAPTASAAVDAAYAGLKQKLARLLAIPAKEVQPDRSVASYGVDSLISVELSNWISGQLGGHVQMLELMSSMSIVQLAEAVARRSRLVPVGVFEASGQS